MGSRPGGSTELEGFKAGLRCDTDFTIKVGEYSWDVHKAVLSSSSRFFDCACNGLFAEANTEVIDLQDEDPFTIARMLQFMYCGEFELPTVSASTMPTPSLSEIFRRFGQTTNHASLRSNDMAAGPAAVVAKLILLAHKYGIPALLAKALNCSEESSLSKELDTLKFRDAVLARLRWYEDENLRRRIGDRIGRYMSHFINSKAIQTLMGTDEVFSTAVVSGLYYSTESRIARLETQLENDKKEGASD